MTRKSFKVGSLKYDIYIWQNPPYKLSFKASKAGVILLALDDDVPTADNTNAEIKAEKAAGAGWHGLENLQHFVGQEYEFSPGQRQVTMYVKEPTLELIPTPDLCFYCTIGAGPIP